MIEQVNTLMFKKLLKAHKRLCDTHCSMPAMREACEYYNMEYGLGIYCDEMMEEIERRERKGMEIK